jgi:hypothetical protein
VSDGIPTKAEVDSYTKELRALRNGVGNVTLAWADVENAHVELLTAILNLEYMKFPAAMYFSLTGLDSRLRMVNAALQELLHEQREAREVTTLAASLITRIEALWKTITNKLNRLRGTRNKVAHGQIVTVVGAGGWSMGVPRLTSPQLDWAQFRTSQKRKQLPGLSANDLNVSQKAVYTVAMQVREFATFVRLMHVAEHSSLLRKFAELEGLFQTPAAQADTQTPPKPEAPPES